MTGIYCIENIHNGKRYIGQSVDIKKRWVQHKQKLNHNAHYNEHLQSAWNLYGKDAFNFYVVELCDETALDDREMFYIQAFDSKDNGYNETYGGEGTRGVLHTDEWKERMRALNLGKTMSDEAKAKMSAVHKGKPRTITDNVIKGYKIVGEKLKGRIRTPEHCKHLSEGHKGQIPWNKGKKMPDDYNHPMLGKHLSNETKRKLSEAKKGTKKSLEARLKVSKKVQCVETGEIFNSITFAAEKYGVSIYAISKVLRGKAETSCKMHWIYYESEVI